MDGIEPEEKHPVYTIVWDESKLIKKPKRVRFLLLNPDLSEEEQAAIIKKHQDAENQRWND